MVFYNLIKRTSRSLSIIKTSCRNLNSKIPTYPVPSLEHDFLDPVKIDRNTILLLEKLSLVSYDTDEGIKILEDSIAFANKVLHINTDDVEPLYSVLEDENLFLRQDKITQGNCQKDILRNAALKEDDYFVAPIGNIPLHEVEEPSQILMKNIHSNWLQYIYAKTNKHLPIFVSKYINKKDDVPSAFGTIKQDVQIYNEKRKLELSFNDNAPVVRSELKLDLIVPQQVAMQYFIQWQRYRKYWWSSISTTPSLFSVSDFKFNDTTANVDIVARFPFGFQPVESITVQPEGNSTVSRLSCVMTLEDALMVLLLDGLTSNAKEEYLRLHRKIAPFKISFALDSDEDTFQRVTLCKLATLLHHKLTLRRVSTWLPNFSVSYQSQIKENRRMGVTYTAVLNEATLNHGILKLLNSSTMLGEQIHVADFHKYASLIFEN